MAKDHPVIGVFLFLHRSSLRLNYHYIRFHAKVAATVPIPPGPNDIQISFQVDIQVFFPFLFLKSEAEIGVTCKQIDTPF